MSLEQYFSPFAANIIGHGASINTPYGSKKLIYADWTASGREYGPIEELLKTKIGPYIGNTHTETTFTGSVMTKAYAESKRVIKKHVKANEDDILLFAGSGMTGAINKLQRIMGLRYPERVKAFTRRTNPLVQFLSGVKIPKHKRPVVFISHMEHHSNHTSWLETIAKVEIIQCDDKGLVDIAAFEKAVQKYSKNRLKIAAITACSNVTGIITPYHEIAEIIHKANGFCIVDFACSAPYVEINMHPKNPLQHLDAICFSPHKFLGGPGTTGVLIFNKRLYLNNVPDNPGGGTVVFTNPWNLHAYIDNIEDREDGGTPPFLQGIKTALAVKLKERMGQVNIKKQEEELVNKVFAFAQENPWFNILSGHNKDRLPIFSFFIDGIHYNLLVRVLNDKYGIQMRGGCACAGTYGHILLNLNQTESMEIYNKIIGNDNSCRPGWVRMSLHPTTSEKELQFIFNSLKEIHEKINEFKKDYQYDNHKNAYFHHTKNCQKIENEQVEEWYKTELI